MNEKRENPNHELIPDDFIRRRDVLGLLERTADPETFERQFKALQEAEAPKLQPWTEGSKRMLKALRRLLVGLGMRSNILAVFGSWGDTLPDDEVADMMEVELDERWPAIVEDAARARAAPEAP